MTDGKPEFDSLARDYEKILDKRLAAFGFETGYFDEYKVRYMHDFFSRLRSADHPRAILNFGCGIGKSEPYLRHYFGGASIFSVDISEESVAIARRNNSGLSDVFFTVFDGVHIPFEVDFDAIMAANVFHHIPRADHLAVVRSILGKLKRGGHLFLFEHNPLNPLTLRVVRSCPFDENAVLLRPCYARRLLKEAGFSELTLRFVVFFPRSLSLFQPIEVFLGVVPFGAQYCVIASRT